MTSPPSDGPAPALALVAQLRERWHAGDQSWLDEARALTQNPLAREMARILHLDLDPLAQVIRDNDRMFETVATSIWGFAQHGWAPSGNMPIPIYEAALHVLAAGGSLDAAQDALVEGWNARSVLPYLHHRVLGLGLGNDEELESWYRERGRLVERAWEHHQGGSYEAAIPIVLSQVDGITADATTTPGTPRGRVFFSTYKGRQA